MVYKIYIVFFKILDFKIYATLKEKIIYINKSWKVSNQIVKTMYDLYFLSPGNLRMRNNNKTIQIKKFIL